MHTGTFGKFVSGRDSILVYGGLSDTGQALQDFWYYDLVMTNLKFGHNFLFRLGTIPDPSRWTSAELTAAYSDLKVILAKYIKVATTDPESLQVCRDYEPNCDKELAASRAPAMAIGPSHSSSWARWRRMPFSAARRLILLPLPAR